MKSIPLLWLAFWILPGMVRAETLGQNVLFNSDFESKKLSPSWTIRPEGVTEITLGATSQSPFSEGIQGVHIHTIETALEAPKLTQQFSPTDQAFQISFDFRVTDATIYSGTDGVLVIRLFSKNTEDQCPALTFMGTGEIKWGKHKVDLFSKNTWYHVLLTVPASDGTETPTLHINPQGKEPTLHQLNEWEGSVRRLFHYIQIQPGFGNRPGTDVDIDNVQLVKK